MHPFKSIVAHYQTYIIQHFTRTADSKKLTKLKNTHSDEPCFIIGNGPSLTIEDLNRIQEQNIPTFAFNRIYLIFDKTSWRPTYYLSQDEKILVNSQDQMRQLDLQNIFIPIQCKFYYGIKIPKATYFLSLPSVGATEFSKDISTGIYNSSTVLYSAVQMAVYMGFKKIYLIGVDHSFSTYKNDNGEIVKDENAKDYFTEDYNTDKSKLYIPNMDASTRTYIALKKHCDNLGIEIYNATRGGKLEVFPRVDFDSLF